MKLALGTVQFGLAYGIAGRGQPVPEHEVRAILADAAERGVTLLDTAAAYGDIEQRLARLTQGLALSAVSKVPAIPDALTPAEAAAFALASAQQSRQRLGERLVGLMLHRAQDLSGPRGDAVHNSLRRWAEQAGIAFGASCYEPDEAVALRQQRGLALAQLPGNAFDQRVDAASAKAALAGVDIHLRSVFLQGLLLIPEAAAAARLPSAAAPLRRFHAWCAEQGLPPLVAALAVAKSFRAVSTLLVGVDSLAQWTAIAQAWQLAAACPAAALTCSDVAVIDLRRWPAPAPTANPAP